MSGLGLALAALAAVAINAAYVLQHSALLTTPDVVPRAPVASVRALLASPRWVAAALLGYAGLAAQVAALALAPLWAVQAVVAAGLVVALAGWARTRVHPLSRGERGAIALLGLGLLAVAAGGAPGGRAGTAPLTVAAFTAVTLALAGVVLRAPGRWPSTHRDAVAAGLLYGITTVALAEAVTVVSDSVAVTAAALGLAFASALAGLLRFQHALQVGPPIAVVLMMSAAMNISAISGGAALSGPATLGVVTIAGLATISVAGAAAALPTVSAAIAADAQ